MAINFNALPQDKPYSNPEAGTYYGTIEKAEMKQGKDASKPPYLNLQIALTTKEGKKAGKVFDILADSEASLVQYKIQRFITALELPIQGSFELKDLTKIVEGKKLILDVAIDNKGDRPRAVVDALKDMIYYRLCDRDYAFHVQTAEGDNTEALFINAEDAEDSPSTPQVLPNEEY